MRHLDIPRYTTATGCLQELKSVYFPNGKSLAGNVEDMEFKLADFKCQTINMCDDFSFESYKQRYSLHTPRLFLFSRDSAVSSEQSDDEELDNSPFDWFEEVDECISYTTALAREMIHLKNLNGRLR